MRGRKRVDDSGSGNGGSSGGANRWRQKLSREREREREREFGGKIPKKVRGKLKILRGKGKQIWSKSEPWQNFGGK